MKGSIPVFFAFLFAGCSANVPQPTEGIQLQGQWVKEQNGDVMLDPQTSGLVNWRGKLLSLSDASAHETQRHELHVIDPDNAQLQPQGMSMLLSEKVVNSCFGQYLQNKPDYEALVVDVDDDNVFYIVTEDATRTGELTPACKSRYADSGSTDYPTVLVKLELQQDSQVRVSAARPLQFDPSFDVGNYPNDGIEGMAMGPDRTLFLALEKDNRDQPRIFTVKMDETFWATDDFIKVTDPQLKVPTFTSGNHPINGMDYWQTDQGQAYLVAAARNDNEIWFIDVAGQKDTVVVPVVFYAPTDGSAECTEFELMDNFSIEGVAASKDGIWLINDPWKRNYEKNIQCPNNAQRYKNMAPLLFKLPVEPSWFAE